MKLELLSTLIGLLAFTGSNAAPSDGAITWLVVFDGKSPPQTQGWKPIGSLAANARIGDGGLRIIDDSATEMGGFRARWTPDPSAEVIVEARVRVQSVKAGPRGGPGPRWGTMIHPGAEGAPVGLLVSNGRFQQGLVLCAEKITTFLERMVMMDTQDAFHDFRLEIRANHMKVYVDGALKILGEGAFATPSKTSEPFVQFGSNSPPWMGDAIWSSVKLGIRQAPPAPARARLRITIGKPWDIPPPAAASRISVRHPHGAGVRHTRPFLHSMGNGLLLMSVAQGPDTPFEPYGVLKSTDEGRTWSPIDNLQLKTFAPQSMTRVSGTGQILGLSRWTMKYQPPLRASEDGGYIGMTYHFDPQARTFSMSENRVLVPEGMGPTIMFSRDLFDLGNNEFLASAYCATAENTRRSYLLKSVDNGATWTHYATLGNTAEPSVVRLSATAMTAILRTGDSMPFVQTWSADAGKTWTTPVPLEEGSVDPDMVLMSNRVLACSYGRPGSNIMFSLDGGRTWEQHRVITEEKGFNYTAIREVSPGRLLFVHDAPRMQALYVDVVRQD